MYAYLADGNISSDFRLNEKTAEIFVDLEVISRIAGDPPNPLKILRYKAIDIISVNLSSSIYHFAH